MPSGSRSPGMHALAFAFEFALVHPSFPLTRPAEVLPYVGADPMEMKVFTQRLDEDIVKAMKAGEAEVGTRAEP